MSTRAIVDDVMLRLLILELLLLLRHDAVNSVQAVARPAALPARRSHVKLSFMHVNRDVTRAAAVGEIGGGDERLLHRPLPGWENRPTFDLRRNEDRGGIAALFVSQWSTAPEVGRL